NVIVIGGGDTGSDCVGTSNRQGAVSVTQLELMPKPPGDRTLYMPWPLYPMILKTTSSHEEGVSRQWAVATKEFVGDSEGNVKANEKNFETNLKGIFAAGDMRKGQSLVVWAISEGRDCARKVDEYLNS